LFRPKNSLELGLQLIRPEFCNWLCCAQVSRMSVYTELTFDDIAAIVADYDLGALRQFSGIAAGIENSNFFVDTEHGRFVLTIFERMDGEVLPWFMQLMRHLSLGGLPSPAVQQQRSAELLFRYRARNYPNTLSEDETSRWNGYRKQKFTDPACGIRTLNQINATIESIQSAADTSGTDLAILEDILAWLKHIAFSSTS